MSTVRLPKSERQRLTKDTNDVDALILKSSERRSQSILHKGVREQLEFLAERMGMRNFRDYFHLAQLKGAASGEGLSAAELTRLFNHTPQLALRVRHAIYEVFNSEAARIHSAPFNERIAYIAEAGFPMKHIHEQAQQQEFPLGVAPGM